MSWLDWNKRKRKAKSNDSIPSNRQRIQYEFNSFYKDKFNAIYNYTYSYIQSLQDTEDIVAEAFIALWNLDKKIESHQHAKNLIYRITKNKINDFLRKKYKVTFKETSYEEEVTTYELIENTIKPNDTYKKLLKKLIQNLNDKEKLIYKYKYKENLSNTLVAKKLGITTNNVKVINNRMIKKLIILRDQAKRKAF